MFFISVTATAGLAMTEFAINATTPWEVDFANDELAVSIIALGWAGAYFGTSFVFGRTPGMSLLGVRIVRADGSDIDTRHGLIRWIAFPLGFLTLGIGFLGIIIGRERRAIYDTIADTAVVYDWDAEAMRIREIANRGGRKRARERAPGEGAAGEGQTG